MIVKYIINSVKNRSKLERILRLASYIWRPKNVNGQEKCVYAKTQGFFTRKRRSQMIEMQVLALEATRCKDPIAHFVLCWPSREQPSPKQVDEAVAIFMRTLGLDEHQVIYGLHADTDNDHVHLAINLVHPVLNNVAHLSLASIREAAHHAIAKIEHGQGWQREENGRYFIEENGEFGLASEACSTRQPSQRARTLEWRTGVKSAQRIAIEYAGPIINKATSWMQLHGDLAAEGMQYLTRKKGAIIRVGNVHVKASWAGQEAGFLRLQDRLGTYEPIPAGCKVQPRSPEPLAPNLPGWDVYYLNRTSAAIEKKKAQEQLQEKQKNEKTALHAQQEAERSLVFKGSWVGLGLVLNVLRKMVGIEHHAARQHLTDLHKAEREQFQRDYPPSLDYGQWVVQHNPAVAPKASQPRPDRHQFVLGTSSLPVSVRAIPSFTAVNDGTQIRYDNAEAEATGAGRTAFVERPEELVIHDWKNKHCLLAALSLAKEKWGSFSVIGSSAYKTLCAELAVRHDFTITNPEMQKLINKAREAMLQKRKVKFQGMAAASKESLPGFKV